MFPQALRVAAATSLCVGIAGGGAASAQTNAATVTSLSVRANGSQTGSVAAGTVVTLTAQVTAGSANVSPGQVNFCDATATYCTDIQIIATAQLTSSGTATYKFRPGIGSHSYKAVFVGTNSYAGSASSASSLTVTGTTGPFATATSIAETGAWGNYTLTGTVTEAGGTVAPTGTVSFLDASNGNSVLATGSLGAAIAGVGWPNPGSLTNTNTEGTYFVLVVDLNGDGIPDVVLGSNPVSIYLGHANGTYTLAATISVQQAPTSYPIVIADFNGDGIPDLVATNYFEDGAHPTIFLGKGDGTFTAPTLASFTLEYFPTSIVVGDFNGDGILDLAFSDLNGVEIASGNGDGTFNETSASPIQVPNELYSLQAGDFNQDGKLDLAGLDNYFDEIVLLEGAGDGTFTVIVTTPVVSTSFVGPFQIAAADFNGDGVPDLAMLTKNVNTASILLTVPTETATATVNGIAPIGAGTHNVDASYAGDSNYSALTSSTIQLITTLTGVSDMPTCSLNPTSVTISGAAAQASTLIVNTTAELEYPPRSSTSGTFTTFDKR
jgi:hypothetical protein